METKTHYLKRDFRITSLNYIISSLDKTIKSLFAEAKNGGGYDITCALEDSEHIYGLAFIAFQNYINGSVKDFQGNSLLKYKFYESGEQIIGFQKTNIQLIITLANYIKHVEEKDFDDHVKTCLEHFNLRTDKEFDIDNSPIFEGLAILHENSDLIEIKNKVKLWRDKLWE